MKSRRASKIPTAVLERAKVAVDATVTRARPVESDVTKARRAVQPTREKVIRALKKLHPMD